MPHGFEDVGRYAARVDVIDSRPMRQIEPAERRIMRLGHRRAQEQRIGRAVASCEFDQTVSDQSALVSRIAQDGGRIGIAHPVRQPGGDDDDA